MTAEPKGKALDLMLSLHSYPHPWSWAMGHDWKNKVTGKIHFLRTVAGLSLRDEVWSSVIRDSDLLLLYVGRGLFRHLVRIPPGHHPTEVFMARPAGRRPQGRPRTRWRDYISSLAWEYLLHPQSELASVPSTHNWGSLVDLLHYNSTPNTWLKMDGWI